MQMYYVKAVTRQGYVSYSCYQSASSPKDAIATAKMYGRADKGCRWTAELVD